jgi:hypothetical protein
MEITRKMNLFPGQVMYFFYVALQPNTGYGLLIYVVFEITHTHDAPQSAGLLWTSDQLVAETST